MSEFAKFFGIVSVGSKGQIVIPVEARRAINIKPGDRVIIMSGPPHAKRMLNIIPEDEFSEFLKHFEEHLTRMKKVVHKK